MKNPVTMKAMLANNILVNYGLSLSKKKGLNTYKIGHVFDYIIGDLSRSFGDQHFHGMERLIITFSFYGSHHFAEQFLFGP